MKIAVYNIKGSTGKTPIATNIAFDLGYAVVTNEKYHILGDIFPEERVMQVPANKPFPRFPNDLDVVFDLGGFIEGGTPSVASALGQADIVIIPVNNELKALRNTIHTIEEVSPINSNILVVGTKLEKKDKASGKWELGDDFQNIKRVIHSVTGKEYPILPLKLSKVFEAIFDEEKSIKQIVNEGGLAAYTYNEVAQQFSDIYTFLKVDYE